MSSALPAALVRWRFAGLIWAGQRRYARAALTRLAGPWSNEIVYGGRLGTESVKSPGVLLSASLQGYIINDEVNQNERRNTRNTPPSSTR